MTTLFWCVLSTLSAYLIGAIPFGLLVAKWVAKQDIRAVGSGNIGATNVRRLLGWKYFFVVLLLDALKGALPAWGFAKLGALATGEPIPPWLPALNGLAAILGHNFPVYLKFKGGKGVATSLGVVLVLDPFSTGLAVATCVLLLATIGYMSLSCVIAAIVFTVSRFVWIENPGSAENAPLTTLTLVLLTMMIIKHRKNFVRIAQGKEPKIWDKSPPPEASSIRADSRSPGRTRILTVLLLALALAGLVRLAAWAGQPHVLVLESVAYIDRDRIASGQQRAERVAFSEEGALLAATFPRYGKLGIYRVEAHQLHEIEQRSLDGRPIALRSTKTGFWVLIEPMLDQRHVDPGWMEEIGGPDQDRKITVGYYPTDFALTDDHSQAFALVSERAEGDAHRPLPALVHIDLNDPQAAPSRVLEFAEPEDRPKRIAISREWIAVSLAGSNQIAWIEATDPDRPRLLKRTPLADPGEIAFGAGQTLMAASSTQGLWRIDGPDGTPVKLELDEPVGDILNLGSGQGWACTLVNDSALAFLHEAGGQVQGILPIRGSANLAKIRPLGAALDTRSRRLAVANQSGGSLHLIEAKTP